MAETINTPQREPRIAGRSHSVHSSAPGSHPPHIPLPTAAMPLSQSRAGPMPCSSKVCRNLFGPVDHEQIQNDFEELLRQQLEEAQRRWNFNFETETPLEGHFKWERVLLAEQPSRGAFSLAKATSGGDNGSSAPCRVAPKDGVDGVHHGAAQQSSEPTRVGSPQRLKRGQTTVKDFYSSKRRVVHDKPKL
ncbi:cyclin-dependent kinase inhibitor 1 [Meleagris gallopavo]|nr:cyclin-dependent kinase inhibitor 1 [Meleagris gallopavo]